MFVSIFLRIAIVQPLVETILQILFKKFRQIVHETIFIDYEVLAMFEFFRFLKADTTLLIVEILPLIFSQSDSDNFPYNDVCLTFISNFTLRL